MFGCSTPTASRCLSTSSTTDAQSPGWRLTFRRWAGGPTGWLLVTRPRRDWHQVAGYQIANEQHRLTVDPARGGAVTSWLHNDREMIADGRVGNELAVYQEYPGHPTGGEGPWHLVPHGVGGLLVGRTPPRCAPTTARSASGSSCTVRSPACCATPRRSRCGAVCREWTAAPASRSSPAPTGCCGCAGRARYRAARRSAK